jgi:hypothetical protein
MTAPSNDRAGAAGHTPGQWIATERSGYHEILAPDATCDWYGREKMHAVAYCDTEIDEAEQLANASLIASAPDLYAALVAAKQEMWLSARHQWTMADFKNWAVIQQIDAALEKADCKARAGGDL